MQPEINESIDIKEEDIAQFNKGAILKELLTDHTKRQLRRQQTGDKNADAFIIWATNDYVEDNGDEYRFECEIRPELVTGDHRYIIMPRVLKDKMQQAKRSKDKAEVFTPSWVCNAQNNLIDEAWFGRKDVFNREYTSENGEHLWEPTKVVDFEGSGKSWEDYIRDTRMEITCGEGPYLVSRYDTTTGEEIPLEKRIGLLDRKMRVINENVQSLDEWKKWAKIAYHNIYGFEWQGDNLLLAREALFYTLLDYYEDIQKRLGMKLDECDAYVNVAGGMRISEPAMDLAIVAAVISSYKNVPVDAGTIFFGEVGLTGEVRAVSLAEQRVAEAGKLGFTRCVLPAANVRNIHEKKGIEIISISSVGELIRLLLP